MIENHNSFINNNLRRSRAKVEDTGLSTNFPANPHCYTKNPDFVLAPQIFPFGARDRIQVLNEKRGFVPLHTNSPDG